MTTELLSARDANAFALALRGRGEVAGAVAVLRDAAARFPHDVRVRINLGFVLAERGELHAALRAYDEALRGAPDLLEPHVAKGLLLVRLGRNDEAEAAFLAALAVDPYEPRANFALYELRHVKGDVPGALAYQGRALARQTLFSRIAPQERRRVLVLCAPGDLQANIPLDFLVDPRTTTVHRLYLVDEERVPATALPPHDVVLNAIAESPSALPALELAARLARGAERPFLNRPERVLRTSREGLVAALEGAACRLAPIARRTRDELLAAGSPIPYPTLVRPVGSHAGAGLAKVDGADALRAYLAANGGEAFYLSAFVDYRSADGYYRKYRVICVDGEPYPCHLAISPRWMIHYYNAPMAEHRWMRDEEARFLADLPAVFGESGVAALREIAGRLDLEYFGIDCALDRDGGVLVFEADPAMVVHVSDPVDLYPYKRQYVPRIFAAFERMLDAFANIS